MRSLSAHILGAVLLVSWPVAASAKEVKIGSIIHLQNRFSEGGRVNYLDARARVMDQPAFKGVSENVFVFTDGNKDRDNGSGSWKVVSASGKKDGETLAFGDKIHLQNMYFDSGFLDEWGDKLVSTSDLHFRGGQEAWTVSLKGEALAKGESSSKEPVCSKNVSATPLDVKWENKTGADITVHWVSQECQAQEGQLVKAGAAFTGRSYPGHVFVVFLAESGTELKPITVGPSTAAAPITR